MTGLEPLVADAAVKSLAGIVIKTVWDGGGKLLGLFGETLPEKTRQLIFNASQQYVQNYTKRHGILKVLGMREPVPLESVYTAVQFLGEEDIRRYDSAEALEQAYRDAQRRSFQNKDSKRQEGLKVANEKQYLMVLGGPGAGKSTFLRKIGLEALKGKRGGFKHECIPVFIELKRFNASEINIEKVIAQEFETCGFPSAQKFTAKALEQGKLLILLDGLDEVPTENINEAIRQIQDFVDRHNKNRFIASCRVAAYRHNFKCFSDVAMADFNDLQIEKFITNWFSGEPDTGKDCWQKLNSEDYTAAKELTQTPLLLTLVCLLYQRSRQFPTNRSTLYEKALRVLLEEWAAEKNLPQEPIYKGLDTKRKELMLSKIAHDTFQSDRLFLPRREVADQVEQLLKELLPDEKLINGADVLRTIEVQHGVLVERAEGIYSFSHLTLQEYLTAQYIDDHRQIEQLVAEHLTDKRWREVFLLVAGLMRGGADELLLRMEKEAQKYINTPKLKALLRWADQATAGSEGNFKPVAKRAYAIINAITNTQIKIYADIIIYGKVSLVSNIFAIPKVFLKRDDNTFNRAFNDAFINASTISKTIENAYRTEELKILKDVNFTVLIARLKALNAKFSNEQQPPEVFREHIMKTWLTALNINPKIVNLSKEEETVLENYFYANSLVASCKESAVRVSPQTWEAIEERMLLVPSD